MKPGIYRTRDGKTAVVDRVSRHIEVYPVRGRIGDRAACWSLSGSFAAGNPGKDPDDLLELLAEIAPAKRARLPRIWLMMLAYAVIHLAGTTLAIFGPWPIPRPDSAMSLLLAFALVWSREADK